jgi:hypothetical protein
MGCARAAAGPATGGLSGNYPDPGPGLASSKGWQMYEEGLRSAISNLHGDLRWPEQTIAGVTVFSHPSPSADTEAGLLRVQTGINANDGGAYGYQIGVERPFFKSPPAGSIWACKLRNVTDGLQRYTFSGFVETYVVGAPAAAVVNSFIGVICEATAGTARWIGRVRSGATSTDVDLGVDADTTFRIVGFEHMRDEMSGVSLGIQWFTLDASLGDRVLRTNVGSPVSTNLPTVPLSPVCLGVQSRSAGARIAEVDFWNLGGTVAR